jgi:hypothetical protein
MNLFDEACQFIGGSVIVLGLIWVIFKIWSNTPENKRYKEIWDSYEFSKTGKDPYGNDVMTVSDWDNKKHSK